MDFFYLYHSVFATLMTWGLTALGAATVFFFKKNNEKKMSFVFGFASGVMIAASFFSLLLPGIELSVALGQNEFLPVSFGFLLGGAFILVVDLFLPKINVSNELKNESSPINQKILLVLAITLHNIPEGLAIGVAFGSAALGLEEATIASAWVLALGIGLQNFPEGMAVSMPLRNDDISTRKAFFIGQASGIVEPISAIIGVILAMNVREILPVVLGFAAGAMIYVVVEELIPSGKTNKENKFATMGVIMGFIVMMILDIALG